MRRGRWSEVATDKMWDFLKSPEACPEDLEGTVAWSIELYLKDVWKLGKPVGESQAYSMRAIQRKPIGMKMVAKLDEDDFLLHCTERREQDKVCPATIMHDLSNMRVVFKYVRSARKSCRNFTAALLALETVQPMLMKLNLIGKSTPRTRRPTDQEIAALLDYFSKPAEGRFERKIRMPEIIAFALASTRRLGEICRITHGDVDWAKGTYWVRDVKHPTKKTGNHKEFALFPELAEIIRRQPRIGTDPAERVFPFNAKSASAAYTLAKKRLGIEGLRFHDCRREAITRWMAKLGQPSKVRQISGHETSQILERVYDKPRPEALLAEMAA